MSTILVTGATGNVGSEVVRFLLQDGANVRAAILPTQKPRDTFNGRVAYVPFDFGDKATHAPALDGVTRMFLMRPPAISDTRRYIDPVIAQARASCVSQIVFLSLLGAEKNPVVPHAGIEKSILASGVPYTFLRPSFFMQNLSTTHRADIKEYGEIYVPAGQGKTSFIDVRDIAAVAAKTLIEDGHANKAYPLTGDVALDYSQVALIFSAVLGRRITYPNPSILGFARRMRQRGLNWSYIGVMIGIYTTAKLGMAGGVTDEAHMLLGRPTITMQQFVQDYRDCWL
ncbi:MAG: SDR family oxidoreductase [Anaerolineae bacterium]